MSICNNCQRGGDKLKDIFTFKERVHMLTATTTMRKFLDANVNAPNEDKEVSSSIVTKLLLSFQPAVREELLQRLRESSGVGIVLKNCPHGLVAL